MACGCGNKSIGVKVRAAGGGGGCPKCGSQMRSVHKMEPKTRRLTRSLTCSNNKCGFRKL